MATTVIIPARNEEKTIGPIVGAFAMHPECEVYVAIDRATTDKTAEQTLTWGGVPIPFQTIHGKGEVVYAAVNALQSAGLISHRIILCDGDYTGLTFDHINRILRPQNGMTIGVPDWPDCDVPNHVTNAWPRVSGFRCLPWTMIPANAHGYLLETQLNLRAIRDRMSIREIFMTGLKSPFTWPLPARREAALRLDQEWGMKNGVF